MPRDFSVLTAAFAPADPLPEQPGLLDGMPVTFLVFFGVVVVLIVAGGALVVLSAIRNARRLRQAGIDPLTAQSELLVRLHGSQLLAGGSGLEEKLAELDRLHEKGRISAHERQQARAALLGGPTAP